MGIIISKFVFRPPKNVPVLSGDNLFWIKTKKRKHKIPILYYSPEDDYEEEFMNTNYYFSGSEYSTSEMLNKDWSFTSEENESFDEKEKEKENQNQNQKEKEKEKEKEIKNNMEKNIDLQKSPKPSKKQTKTTESENEKENENEKLNLLSKKKLIYNKKDEIEKYDSDEIQKENKKMNKKEGKKEKCIEGEEELNDEQIKKRKRLTIIFAHGNGESIVELDRFAIRIAKKTNCHVYLMEYPGYPETEGRAREKNCYLSAEAVYKWIVKERNVDPSNLIWFGHSLGSGVVLEMASKFPCAGVFLMSPLLSIFRVVVKLCCNVPFDMFVNIKKAPKVKSPTMIIHGTDDSVVSVSHGKRLYKLLPETFDGVWVKHADHNNIESRFRKQFYFELNRFIQHIISQLPKKDEKEEENKSKTINENIFEDQDEIMGKKLLETSEQSDSSSTNKNMKKRKKKQKQKKKQNKKQKRRKKGKKKAKKIKEK